MTGLAKLATDSSVDQWQTLWRRAPARVHTEGTSLTACPDNASSGLEQGWHR